MSKITDGADLLFQILGGEHNIGRLLDLTKLPSRMLEVEHKFRLPEVNGRSDGGLLFFTARLGPYLDERKAEIRYSAPFVGIDQYYTVESYDNLKVSFRFRLGANKPPELTAKFAVGDNGNEVRGEINLDVSNNKVDSIRGMLTLITKLAKSSSQFAVRQDGLLVQVFDPEHGLLEIVNYRVGGVYPPRPQIPFVEIESKARDVEAALLGVEVYAKGLGLTDMRCEQSIAELFAQDT